MGEKEAKAMKSDKESKAVGEDAVDYYSSKATKIEVKGYYSKAAKSEKYLGGEKEAKAAKVMKSKFEGEGYYGKAAKSEKYAGWKNPWTDLPLGGKLLPLILTLI